MSPRKMRVVANLVRDKKVEDAVGLLDLMPKRAAGIISKAIKSAAANAEDKSGGDASIDQLRIHFEFDKHTSWPDVVPEGWNGPIQYTVWILLRVNRVLAP